MVALLGEIVVFASRILFLIKDLWGILKWNVLFLARVVVDFFPWLGKLGRWIMEFFAIAPGLAVEGVLSQVAKWINLALASSCCGFIVEAVRFPDLVSSIHSLAYFTGPWRLQYGIACILCALVIRFIIKLVPKSLPMGRLPRLPSLGWPKLPGSGGTGV